MTPSRPTPLESYRRPLLHAAERFDLWGAEVAAIIIAMIVVNQLVGPPLFRFALNLAGEAGMAKVKRTPNTGSPRQNARPFTKPRPVKKPELER